MSSIGWIINFFWIKSVCINLSWITLLLIIVIQDLDFKIILKIKNILIQVVLYFIHFIINILIYASNPLISFWSLNVWKLLVTFYLIFREIFILWQLRLETTLFNFQFWLLSLLVIVVALSKANVLRVSQVFQFWWKFLKLFLFFVVYIVIRTY